MNTDKLLLGFLIATFCYSAVSAIQMSSAARRNKVTQQSNQLAPFDSNLQDQSLTKTEHN